jgi:hypothetical protein
VELADDIAAEYWRLHGSHLVVSLPSPAAGAALTTTVPGAVQWDVIAVSFLFTASANAATRIPFVSFLDQGGTTFAKINTAFNFTAANHGQVTFGRDVESFGANNALSVGAAIPHIRLLDGLRVQVSADAIDVADTITAARLYVCQYDVAGY